ncbi:MAG: DNA polymerase III subunit gamma/tau [Oscillospiraceae bacterium]|nr:DNA polymerase III subunit gamma/tau [Oscillospiraceae bacterium]
MYQALYRKWRPLQFPDVLSQPHVTTTLQNQVKAGTTAHAYLFTGSRGTGKTTCARILAKAVNCEHPLPDGNPCLKCSVCQDADKGILSDFIEIDAASNNSVEDIRELRDAIVYTPERCQFKVYIIDEVHMLSPSAFNALLKIMEEPPAYVKFILATTEIHKVPATIISRCQRYDFRRIQQKDIVKKLNFIASQEQIEITKQAVELIARISDGGMRDAISLLDRCSAYNEIITDQIVSESAGTAGRNYFIQILQNLYANNIPESLKIIAELHDNSKDLQRLCEELILMQRDIMLLKATGDISLLHSMTDEIPTLQNIASAQDMSRIMQILENLQICRERMTKAVNKRTELELYLIRICNNIPAQQQNFTHANHAEININSNDLQALYARIAKLEQGKPVPENPLTKPQTSSVLAEPKPEIDMKNLKLSDFQVLAQWAEILEECAKLNPAVVGSLAGSKAVCYANVILITAENPLFLTMFKIKENAKSLDDAIAHVMGKRYAIRAKCSPEAVKPQTVQEMLERAKNSGIPTTAV